MAGIRKLLAVFRRGGARAAIRALAGRFVFKRWRSLVYVDDPARPSAELAWPSGYAYRWYASAAEMSRDERTALQRQGFEAFLSELGSGDALYVIWHATEVASFGAVMMRSPQRDVLGLPPDACLIGLCETLPEHRQLGLYSRALAQTVRGLRQAGHRSVFVEVREDNTASIRGITRAGLQPWRHVDAEIWLGCLVRRDGRWHRLRRRD